MAYVDARTSSFRTLQKFYEGDRAYIKAYVSAGIDGNTPVFCLPDMGTSPGWVATALAASTYGIVGVPKNANSIATACVGDIQIEGFASDVQAGAGSCTGSTGDAVYWGATLLGATSSSYIGEVQQVALLVASANASTTIDIYLTGRFATPIA